MMVVLLEVSPISTEEPWSSVQGPSPRVLSLAGRPALGRVSVVKTAFCSWLPSMLQKYLGTLPRSVPRHNPVSEFYWQLFRPSFDLMAWFLLWHVNCGTLYRQVCVFPNHVQSIEFTTGGLQSSCSNNSRMINGIRMHLCSNSGLIAKGLITYVNKVFLFLIFNTFANISKKTFLQVLCDHCV